MRLRFFWGSQSRAGFWFWWFFSLLCNWFLFWFLWRFHICLLRNILLSDVKLQLLDLLFLFRGFFSNFWRLRFFWGSQSRAGFWFWDAFLIIYDQFFSLFWGVHVRFHHFSFFRDFFLYFFLFFFLLSILSIFCLVFLLFLQVFIEVILKQVLRIRMSKSSGFIQSKDFELFLIILASFIL